MTKKRLPSESLSIIYRFNCSNLLLGKCQTPDAANPLKESSGSQFYIVQDDAANPLKESSGSQFYIVQDPVACAALDGDYTVFGETIEGLDVIDAIAAVDTDNRDCPLQDVKIITIKLDE